MSNENRYLHDYEQGSYDPQPASNITYDNTDSGLTADNVQEAIDEVNTDLQSTKDDVGDIKTAIRDTYVTSNNTGVITINADGVKTFEALLGDLKTAMLAAINAIDDDELLVPESLYISSFYSLRSDYTSGWANDTINFSPSFSRAGGSLSTGVIARVTMADNAYEMFDWKITTTGNAVKDWLADVPLDTRSLSFYYRVIKKV